MAINSRSLKKKLDKNNNKRSSNPKANSRSPQPPMASRTIPSNHRKITLFLFAFLIFCVVLTLGFSSNVWTKLRNDPVSPKIYSFDIVNEFDHDPYAFTQGLVYAGNDTLFESTGIYGQSSVRRVALLTGKVEDMKKMDSSYFGEGLTMIDERLFQVTWLKKTGFIYDRYNLDKVKEFTHQMTDGWGLATDGKVLFGSDGTSTIYKIDPRTMKGIEKHVVKFNGKEVPYLNELEFVKDEIWSNVYGFDCIARISQRDGGVVGWILLPELRKKLIAGGVKGIDVLNGIAYDSDKNRIFVTGKLWPKLYEIRLHPANNQYSLEDVQKMCVPPRHYYSFP